MPLVRDDNLALGNCLWLTQASDPAQWMALTIILRRIRQRGYLAHNSLADCCMKTWGFLLNQFANATAGSFRKMLLLSADHAARLAARAAEPGIAVLNTRYAPLHAAYATAYGKWDAATGSQEARTAAVTAQLDLLSSTKARQWDVRTQAAYDAKSPEYKAVWPDGRSPLQNGAIDLRISAVDALHTRMLPCAAALGAPLLAEVAGFYATLLALRATQQGGEGQASADSTALEAARVTAAVMMYGNLGVLMDLYRATPEAVADYWDLSLIREGGAAEPPPTP